jgi:hypothetical protein
MLCEPRGCSKEPQSCLLSLLLVEFTFGVLLIAGGWGVSPAHHARPLVTLIIERASDQPGLRLGGLAIIR